jgi:hypothetical protein
LEAAAEVRVAAGWTEAAVFSEGDSEGDSERQAQREAALSGVLGGWSGATSSTSLTIAEFWAMSRGNLLPGTGAPEPGAARVRTGFRALVHPIFGEAGFPPANRLFRYRLGEGGAAFHMSAPICKSGTNLGAQRPGGMDQV